MKWRNCKERELLSSGSCRQVTLPSKDNPNPDLSDVTRSEVGVAADTDVTRSDVIDVHSLGDVTSDPMTIGACEVGEYSRVPDADEDEIDVS